MNNLLDAITARADLAFGGKVIAVADKPGAGSALVMIKRGRPTFKDLPYMVTRYNKRDGGFYWSHYDLDQQSANVVYAEVRADMNLNN